MHEGDIPEVDAEERGGDLTGESVVGEVEQVKLGELTKEVWDPAGECVLAEVEHTECGREHGEVRWHDTGEMVPKE
jgi:hypothetical protein